jgi:signal transduction histidine kinase/ActR/RegA family two-component response regulator
MEDTAHAHSQASAHARGESRPLPDEANVRDGERGCQQPRDMLEGVTRARLQLLSRTAGRLLAAENPQEVIDELCRDVMTHLDCQAFFNFLSDPAVNKLRLNACAGIPEAEAHRIEWLDYGVTVCGCVANTRQRMVVQDVMHSTDHNTDLIRSYGIQAYCCHPLLAEGGRLIGTLSFGTNKRRSFAADEVDLMQTVSDQVATAVERMHSKAALAEANRRLQEADQRKNEYLAMLSHELRNPLTPITNSLFVLDRAPAGSERAVRARAIIDRQTRQLTRLVDDLLDVTRLISGKLRLRKARFELTQMLLGVAEDYRDTFDNAGIAFEPSVCGGPIWVNGDAARLAQALGNLLSNAAKFTERGGRVTLEASVDQSQPIMTIRVGDTGTGIDASLLPNVFEPFVQADVTLDRSRSGLGLGLTLVKNVVELHGGAVTAMSQGLGAGAEFTLRLPIESEDIVQERNSGGSRTGAATCRVLLIDDNADVLESLRDVLAIGEHEVQVAHDGAEGLSIAAQFKPNVVLCDIGLPGMSGYEVARALRANESLRSVCLVALTGYALPEDERRAKEAGFDHHLPKPPNLNVLERILANVASSNSA